MILDMLDGSKSGPQLEIDLVRINPLRSPGLHLRAACRLSPIFVELRELARKVAVRSLRALRTHS